MADDRVPTFELDKRVTTSATLHSEVQTVTITGAAAGSGNLKLVFDGETTAQLAHDANSAAIQAALEGLSNIDPGDVTAVRVADVITLTFSGRYAEENVPAVDVTEEALKNAATEAIVGVVATTTAGGTATNAVKRGTGLADRTADVSPLSTNSPIAARAADAAAYE